jgi:mannose-6-phosphate isomerase
MSVYPLAGVVRPYAWGSRTAIAQLQGRPAPSPGPEAELWLGAHPGDPSIVTGPDGPVALDALIAADPAGTLGAEVVDEFGARLPYLMKYLAAESPLSLQAHPDAAYAMKAFAEQEADPTAPKNYVDAYHKPEMLVALTPFDALCGFRSPEASADDLERLDLPRLAPVITALRTGPAGLEEAVRLLLTWPADDRAALTSAASAAPEPIAGLARRYPGDPGVLVALLLNHVRLNPGEAIWMPAGNLHAYLSGAGIEIMAASDNVLRGGFTPKRDDVDELLRVLRFEVLENPILEPATVAPGMLTWPVPVRDFVLYRLELDGTRPPVPLPVDGPRIIFGIKGDVFAAEGHGTPVEINPGAAAFAPAAAGPVLVAGTGEVFVAALPPTDH